MNKIFAIGLFLLVCFGSACKRDGEDAQWELQTRKNVSYLFDPASQTCAVVKEIGDRDVAWQVPCTPDVIARLSPSVQTPAMESVKHRSAELPQ